MATRKAPSNEVEAAQNGPTIAVNPQYATHTTAGTIPTWYDRIEVTVAKRLYEVWRTVGGLGEERWDWDKQSTKAQAAWRAVARATLPPVLEKDFGPHQIADVTHA